MPCAWMSIHCFASRNFLGLKVEHARFFEILYNWDHMVDLVSRDLHLADETCTQRRARALDALPDVHTYCLPHNFVSIAATHLSYLL